MKHLIFCGVILSAIPCIYIHPGNGLVRNSSITHITQDSPTIAGKWHLVPVLPSDTAAGKIPEINFDLATNKFSGNTGCNTMKGGFKTKGDALSFGENIISTRMACPGYNEKSFIDNFLKTNRYMIKDGVLQLMYNTTILSKWTRHADSPTTKQI